MGDRVDKIKMFVYQNSLKGWQTFSCRNWIGDPVSEVYREDGVSIFICHEHDYLEVIGLSKEEFYQLDDVLDVEF